VPDDLPGPRDGRVKTTDAILPGHPARKELVDGGIDSPIPNKDVRRVGNKDFNGPDEGRPPTHVPWFFMAFSWIWFLSTVVFFADARYGAFGLFLLSGFAVILAGGIAMAILRPAFTKTSMWQWLSVLLVVAVGMLLLFTDLDLPPRVVLSEGSLIRHVASARRETVDQTPARIGLFQIQETDEINGAVYLRTGSDYYSYHGIAYIPNGKPRPLSRLGHPYNYRHLYGPWYEFTRASGWDG
jgi:hypothetical protein